MQNQPVMGIDHKFFGNDLHQLFLNREHCLAFRETRPVRDPIDMGVDRHRGLPEGSI